MRNDEINGIGEGDKVEPSNLDSQRNHTRILENFDNKKTDCFKTNFLPIKLYNIFYGYNSSG